MRKISLLLIVLILLSCTNISAADNTKIEGTVLYHQDFAEISDIDRSGIKIGTGSTDDAFIDCPGEELNIRLYDKGRVYLILPYTERSSTYTVEFSFSFDEHESDNGYIAFMLTCRGEEPSNISSVIIRRSGAIDDFEAVDPALAAAILSGERINVTIPIVKNVLDQIHLSVGDDTYTLAREKVLVLSNEDFGFAARGTAVNVREVFVVDGIGYTEKVGYYAENSFATDENPVIAEGENMSPSTSDDMPVIVWVVGGSAVALLLFVLLGKKKK